MYESAGKRCLPRVGISNTLDFGNQTRIMRTGKQLTGRGYAVVMPALFICKPRRNRLPY